MEHSSLWRVLHFFEVQIVLLGAAVHVAEDKVHTKIGNLRKMKYIHMFRNTAVSLFFVSLLHNN